MNLRRVIGSILALSLLAGSTFVPLARAACAVPTARTAACPSCAGAPLSSAAAVTVDRSCCAAPASLSEREPATVASDRGTGSGDPRDVGVAALAPATGLLTVVALTGSPRLLPAVPGASPPHLRTTILRI